MACNPAIAAVALLSGALVATGAAPARGQDVTASGSLGAGMFGAQPASAVELGVDAGGPGYQFGLGGAIRWLARDGLRTEEWDKPSEIAAGLVRYAVMSVASEDGERAASVGLGELGGAGLGNGSLIGGYASGLNVDHRHLGAQLRAAGGAVVAEAFVDDVVAPRLGGARVSAAIGERFELGGQIAGDRSAPTSPMDGSVGRAVVVGAALDAALSAGSADDSARGALYGDLVALFGLGAGLHLGGRGDLRVAEEVRIAARAEVRAGTSHYLPGWVGPLYERDRREMTAAGGAMSMSQLDAVRAGGLGGLGAAGHLAVDAPGAGSAELGYGLRRGVSDVVTARLAAPYLARVQAALWVAASIASGGAEAMALSAELRVRLPRRLFARGDLSRLYRDHTGGVLRPLWIAQISVGAVLGEPPVDSP